MDRYERLIDWLVDKPRWMVMVGFSIALSICVTGTLYGFSLMIGASGGC